MKLALPTGYTLVGVPMQQSGGASLTIDAVFSTNVPDDTTIFIFTPPDGPYRVYTYLSGFGGWVDENLVAGQGTNTLSRDTGFWVSLPSVTNATVLGDVPAASNTSVSLSGGYNLISYPYPAARPLSQTAMGQGAQEGDTIFMWNGVGYNVYTFLSGFGGWVDDNLAPANPVLEPGKGYWYLSASGRTASENKPYSYP